MIASPPFALIPARSNAANGLTASPREETKWQTKWLVVLAMTMTALKLICASQTIGSNDVLLFRNFAAWLQTMDLSTVYHHSSLFNHLPLVAIYLKFLGHHFGNSIQAFAFLIRLPGILADLALSLFFLAQRRSEPLASCPGWALALFIASPVSYLVSGFHGNLDSLVVLFMTLGAWMCIRERPLLSALGLALSLQVKVPATIIMPVFFIYWYRHGCLGRFTFGLVSFCAIGWIEPLTHDPAIFVHNVFGYSSYWGIWGITYWLVHTGVDSLQMTLISQTSTVEQVITQLLKLVILSGITGFAWTRRPFNKEKLFPVLALSWSFFFFLTPGAGVQYLVWLAPFVLLYHPRWYLGLTVCCSLACYFFYRIICGGWVLYYGHSTVQNCLVWGPWMLWAWVSTSFGLYLFWKQTRFGTTPLSQTHQATPLHPL